MAEDQPFYELRVGDAVHRVPRAEVEELARRIRSGPEADIAEQLLAAMGHQDGVELGPAVDVIPDDPTGTPRGED